MINMIFQVPGVIVNDKGKKEVRQFIVETGETSPEKITQLINMEGQPGWFTFSIHQIQPKDLMDLPELLPVDEKKTPSQRLRAVMFRMWEQNPEDFKEFDAYYRFHMEKIINWLKQKLD